MALEKEHYSYTMASMSPDFNPIENLGKNWKFE